MRRVREAPGCGAACARVLREGGLVCVPTETVYGLICLPDRPAAVAAGGAQEPPEQALRPVHGVVGAADREAVRPRPVAERLAAAFWPGPLTLVIAAEPECPAARGGTVGARCPDHPLAQEILAECGGLLINTSLNRSGEPAVWSLEGMDDWLFGVDLVIDGGTLPRRPASTVVDCASDPPRILRAGGVTEESLRRLWE